MAGCRCVSGDSAAACLPSSLRQETILPHSAFLLIAHSFGYERCSSPCPDLWLLCPDGNVRSEELMQRSKSNIV